MVHKIKPTEYRVVKLDDIKPNENNPRIIDAEDRDILVKSLETFGNVGVLVLNPEMQLISGHQRLSVLKEFGVTEAMCVVGDYTEAEASELLIFLNTQLGTGQWDKNKLDTLFGELKAQEGYEQGVFEELHMDKLESLELSQHRDLKEFQEQYMPDKDEETPQRQSGESSPIYSHTIVFRDEAELNTFLSWLHTLREKYPNASTTSERILFELVGDERNVN